jgi:dipeptidyl aminopeptidase/acylaminoacyl peptidase
MHTDDLSGFVTPSDPRLHPDGRRIAFAVSRANVEEDTYERSIWLWDGAGARTFTAGPDDASPRWSPDGSKLAFIRGKKKPQVAVIDTGGGEAKIVTDFALPVSEIEWSPDGRWLVATAGTWTEEWAELDDEERERRPRRIERVPFRFDNRGWVHDRRAHLYLVDPEGVQDPKPLTQGDTDDTTPRWRPDGKAIAYLSDTHTGRGFDPGTEVREVDVETGEIHTLVDRGFWAHATYRPDGVMHVVGQPDPWSHPSISAIWRLESGRLTDLTGHLDRSASPLTPAIKPAGLQWVGSAFLTCLEDAGRVRVVRVEANGTVEDVLGGDRLITGVSPSPDGSTFAFVATSPTDPGEVHLWTHGSEETLTTLNTEFRKGAGLVDPHHFTIDSEGADIDTWVYLPDGDGPVPVLLNIHGGPATQYGFGFFDEFQMYVGSGYGVVACNPRGSSGRGVEFVRAVTGDGWGTVDSTDVTAALEAALERFERLDGGRMGVMGGSYGGFLTAWLIGRDHRYRSAVVERALLSWTSFSGTSDIGATFGRYYLDASPPTDVDRLWEKSPLTAANDVTTPTLLIQSENDFRCPIEQAEQYFMMLLRNGVDTEFVRFPGEGHELSRSGKPRHRKERFEFILDWHGRHLGASDVQD